MTTDYLFQKETEKIIEAFYEVYNTLGFGFLERVYQNALFQELKRRGLRCEAQHRMNVFYKEQMVGDYYADIIVNDRIILELKAVDTLCREHELQLINYLKASDKEIGLLLNFGTRPQIVRKIFTNDRKKLFDA